MRIKSYTWKNGKIVSDSDGKEKSASVNDGKGSKDKKPPANDK